MTSYKIVVTNKADKDEIDIYRYIELAFGEIYADRFRSNLIKLFTLLSKQPFIGRPAKNDSEIRVILFNKQNKIIYKINREEVVIIRILNTKTNLASSY